MDFLLRVITAQFEEIGTWNVYACRRFSTPRAQRRLGAWTWIDSRLLLGLTSSFVTRSQNCRASIRILDDAVRLSVVVSEPSFITIDFYVCRLIVALKDFLLAESKCFYSDVMLSHFCVLFLDKGNFTQGVGRDPVPRSWISQWRWCSSVHCKKLTQKRKRWDVFMMFWKYPTQQMVTGLC